MKKPDWSKTAKETMGGSDAAPKKELSHMTVEKSKNGGYIHTHHHTHPEHHPAEKHTTSNQKQMIAHMAASMGQDAPASGDPTDPTGAGAPPADPSAAAAAAPPAAAGVAMPGA